ncbi:hypothetical protein MMC18_007692, partial [Xylographa bjoerkii]|nr:hypothetical protein [Xylographa bjoerkii]
MASIGKFGLSVLSGVQETTVALANMSFDFAMVKIEAPVEYQRLGAQLSIKRKHDAEEGSAHATARKLGALFSKDLPNIPYLAEAYGLRVSEIAESPRYNPRGSDSDGPLAGFVGADGTSIWAAATSGKGALAVHLLACMLARMWSGPEATSIWSELVVARKAVLQEELRGKEFSIDTVTTMKIEVSRTSLAEWDASARSWLRTADTAKKLQQTQLLLVVDKNDLALETGAGFYTNVMRIWTKAMVTVDNLVAGVAQSVQSGEVLLGLSSWHLYPDMSVLSFEVKNIVQNDNLVIKGGLLTIGQRIITLGQDSGVFWSMPLAHLRYYGKPVFSQRSIGSKSSRVSFDKIVLVGLGSAISTWGVQARNLDDIAKFFLAMSDFFFKTSNYSNNASDDNYKTERLLGWLRDFAAQAYTYLHGTQPLREEMSRYIALGRRRYGTFLAKEPEHAPPLFGLSNLTTYLSKLNVESQIDTLRSIAVSGKTGVNLEGAIIRYRTSTTSKVEFASVYPQAISGGTQLCHRRWIFGFPERLSNHYDSKSDIPGTSLPGWMNQETWIERSINIMAYSGEACGFLSPDYKSMVHILPGFVNEPKRSTFEWLSGDEEFEAEGLAVDDFSLEYLQRLPNRVTEDQISRIRRIAGWQSGSLPHRYSGLQYRLILGTLDLGIWQPIDAWQEVGDVMLDFEFLTSAITRRKIEPKILLNHISTIGMRQESSYVRSLGLLHVASKIYTSLPSADVDLSVASIPLHTSKWAPIDNAQLSRQQALACVAMFESGSVNLDPEQLNDILAISSGNSMYALECLFCDPFSPPPVWKLRCLVGNIGKPGLALLMSPRDTVVQTPDLNTWEMVNHVDYDGKLENNFQGTSLHLSLTGYEHALNIGRYDARDKEVFYLGAVISAYHQGVWMADIDILTLLRNLVPIQLPVGGDNWQASACHRLPLKCQHVQAASDNFSALDPLSAIDSWLEFLDPPMNMGV